VETERETHRQLNHVEMVYRPGERELAGRVFELLGMSVVDHGGEWMFAHVDPAGADVANNACYASQVTPAQWRLEQSLTAAMDHAADDADGDGEVGSAARDYVERVRSEPQRSYHFGIRFLERNDFDDTLDRVRAAASDPDLAGRVTLLGLYDPSEPGTLAPGMFQAFVRTDVVAGGLLALGQIVELQWHLPKRASGAVHA
jgi:hypothetical protein